MRAVDPDVGDALERVRHAAPAGLLAAVRWQIARGLALAVVSVGAAAGSWWLLAQGAKVARAAPWGGELVVHLGALLLPVTLLPLIHALVEVMAALRRRRAAWDGELIVGADGFAVRRGGDELRAAWSELLAVDEEGCAHVRQGAAPPGTPADPPALLLTLAPAAGRPVVVRLHEGFTTPLPLLAARLRARAAPVDTSARAADTYAFAEACAGRELPPGCFVVRGKPTRSAGASVGLLLTPRALLQREGDAYRRVPWRYVARVELGSADPHEFVPSDLLVARDAAGQALARVSCRPLALPADALLEVVKRYLPAPPALPALAASEAMSEAVASETVGT